MISVYMGHSGLHVVRIIGIGLPHGHIWILRRIVRFADRRRRRLSWCAKVVERDANGAHDLLSSATLFDGAAPRRQAAPMKKMELFGGRRPLVFDFKFVHHLLDVRDFFRHFLG